MKTDTEVVMDRLPRLSINDTRVHAAWDTRFMYGDILRIDFRKADRKVAFLEATMKGLEVGDGFWNVEKERMETWLGGVKSCKLLDNSELHGWLFRKLVGIWCWLRGYHSEEWGVSGGWVYCETCGKRLMRKNYN